jgi:type IX secretion system PorP/SprF family membrane protein
MILCKRKVGFLLISIFYITTNLFGQDAHYSQFYANPIYLNPAFAGSNNCPRFSINFRDQWPAIRKGLISFSGSYDQHIVAIRSGIGALVTADVAGDGLLYTYNASAIYNFRVRVTHKFNLQFALQGGYLANSINWDNFEFASGKLGFPDGISQEIIDSYQSRYQPKAQFDAAFGFVGYTSYLYFGMAVHHPIPGKKGVMKNEDNRINNVWIPKWTAHIGGKITISQKNRTEVNNGDIFLYPNLIFISQGDFHYMHEGVYFNFYPLTIGAWLRHNFKNLDAFIISCGIEYKLFRIGYSYDFTLTKLAGTGGAHEVSLQFTIPCNNDKKGKLKPEKRFKNIAPVECPKF